MSQPIYKLVYVSSASETTTYEDMMDLLEKSRVNNMRLGITGLLLCYEDNYFQLLEGEKSVVMKLYEKISLDPRHKGIIRIFAESKSFREFPSWSMGYKLIDSSWDVEFREGLNDMFKNGGLDLNDTVVQGASIKIHRLLDSFRQISGIEAEPLR